MRPDGEKPSTFTVVTMEQDKLVKKSPAPSFPPALE